MRATFGGKVAIVTGGASGIGRALCEEMARHGASVVVADVNEKGSADVVAAISAAGGRASAARLDVTRAEDVERLIEETARASGGLDFMFNNAGIAVIGEARDLTLDHWRRVIDVDLMGVVHGSHAAYRLMVKQGRGHIVNVASSAGLGPSPCLAPYSAAKYGVVGLSLTLRAEGAALGVRVSVVCPGLVRSEIYRTAPMVNLRLDDVLAKVPFAPMDTAAAARTILRGVAREEDVIVFPFYARVLWWLGRLSPALGALVGRKVLADLRRGRVEP